jgi:hypothetical protein
VQSRKYHLSSWLTFDLTHKFMKPREIAAIIVYLLAAVAAQAGAWGYKSFENDDALDWVDNFLESGGQSAVEKTIARVAKGSGYLQAPDGCYGIAACETLAAAQGRPSPDIPKDVAVLAKKLPSKVSDSVRKNARDALDRILAKDSELSQLWKDAKGDFEKWKKTVEDLKTRV